MAISLYYLAKRGFPLADEERDCVGKLIEAYNEPMKAHYLADKAELFHLYDSNTSDAGTVLEGATKLPNNQRIVMKYLEQWCRLLSELRCSLSDLEWEVSVDDHQIPWNSTEREFDPWK